MFDFTPEAWFEFIPDLVASCVNEGVQHNEAVSGKSLTEPITASQRCASSRTSGPKVKGLVNKQQMHISL